MKESKGTRLAAEIRAECNNMTNEERHEAYKHSINKIYEGRAYELFEENGLLKQEQQELRAGYTALVQLVQTYQMCKDLSIDWKKFPKNCLCDAHKEILKLRKKLLKYEPAPTIFGDDPEMLEKLNKIKEHFKKDKKKVAKNL